MTSTKPSKCQIRDGIGLCDKCDLPKWPQEYVGNGAMFCLDCIDEEVDEIVRRAKKKRSKR